MSITKPAGRSLTVGELIASLADVDERTPIDITAGIAGESIPLLCVERIGRCIEIAVDVVESGPLLDLLAQIAAGEYTLKRAKAEAVDALRTAGYEVQA
jgi:hypothetical protein